MVTSPSPPGAQGVSAGSGGVYPKSETETSRHPLVAARRVRGWSQEGLAALLQARGLGTTKTTVRRWERGVVPDGAALAALRDLFGVSPETADRLRWPHWLPTGRVMAVAD
jgi:hypothetical protein